MNGQHDTWLAVQYAMVKADRRWAGERYAPPLPPDRMVNLIRAATTAVPPLPDGMVAELSFTRALLRALVEAANGVWLPDVDPVLQVQLALQQLGEVEVYLMSLQGEDEKGAA